MSKRLRNGGTGIASSPRKSHASEGAAMSLHGISVEDATPAKGKKTAVLREPQTARAILEENAQLVVQKKEARSLSRKKSWDFVNKLITDEQKVIQEEKAKDAGRRMAHRELAQYYKTRIAEKESEKATSYRSKVDAGTGTHFFPYIEGERIHEERKLQNAQMREEMRSFLSDQRDVKPPRIDRLMNGDPNYKHQYTDLPSDGGSARLPLSGRPGSNGGSDMSPGVQHPRFLTRPNPHMSRRIQDEHVRRALEDKVRVTKEELERRMKVIQDQSNQFEEGLMVNDALRYDSTNAKSVDRKGCAEYLVKQIQEKKDRDHSDIQQRRKDVCGYFGPDEKGLPSAEMQTDHCATLIEQMEVNQRRKISSAIRRRDQEQRLVDNSLALIAQDRVLERQKLAQHKEVLVTTWDSQRKIRDVLNRLEAVR